MILNNSKIFIAGHNGMVGSSVFRKLDKLGITNILKFSSKQLDLRNQLRVEEMIKAEKPDIIIDAAARVGGILANKTYPYKFIMENLQIQCNLLNSAVKNDIEKFIFLGSSCIYPKFCKQPIKEEYLLTKSLEDTNQSYAIAKISGVKTIDAINNEFNKKYISLMPTNLYGPNDNFDLNSSHVIPALIRKFHEAKLKRSNNVILWGTGSPRREFLHVDDLADAVLFSIQNNLKYNLYNVGTGNDLKILELAELIKNIVGFDGDINWDKSMPDGTPRKLLDVTKIQNEGWHNKIILEDGLKNTYKWFKKNIKTYRKVNFN